MKGSTGTTSGTVRTIRIRRWWQRKLIVLLVFGGVMTMSIACDQNEPQARMGTACRIPSASLWADQKPVKVAPGCTLVLSEHDSDRRFQVRLGTRIEMHWNTPCDQDQAHVTKPPSVSVSYSESTLELVTDGNFNDCGDSFVGYIAKAVGTATMTVRPGDIGAPTDFTGEIEVTQ